MDGNGLVWRTALLIGTTTALIVAGCSDGGSTAAPQSPSATFATDVATTPGMAGTPGMTSMPASPAGGGGTAAGTAPAAPQGGNAVDISGFEFSPAPLTVPVGTTVTWTNRDEEPHTIVAGDGSFRSPGMGTGNTYTYTFTTAGTYDYVCSIHPVMHGTVVVTK